MLQSLLASAILMGLAGSPHCLAMCGAACGALAGRGRVSAWTFHLGRGLSYTAAGAFAAASMTGIAAMGAVVAALRPLWTLVHVAALVLGLYLAWRGHQPAWMENIGRRRDALAGGPASAVSGAGGSWQPVRGPVPGRWRAGAAGLGWAAWPCGLLQSALLVAALANGPLQGAAVMAAFAAASAAGLVLGPALWWRLAGRRAGAGGGDRAWLSPALAVRVAGLALALASAWALGHGLWLRFAAWCFG